MIMEVITIKCPMCGLKENHQESVPENPQKTKCRGCGTKFFDRDKTIQ